MSSAESMRQSDFRALYARELRTITAADLLGLEVDVLERSQAPEPPPVEVPPVEGVADSRRRSEPIEPQRVAKAPAAEVKTVAADRLVARWKAAGQPHGGAAKAPAGIVRAAPAPAADADDPLDRDRVSRTAQTIAERLDTIVTPGKRTDIKAASGEHAKPSRHDDAKAVARARDVLDDLDSLVPADPAKVAPSFEVHVDQASGEPFVTFVDSDRVGLALSGGGIRSATFNLGLLQGLDDHGVLNLIDYLSTVSGGGYIGGWWSTWKFRNTKNRRQQMPRPPQNTPPIVEAPGSARHEANEVRHLREFSNFLVPRAGFFDPDLWEGIAAILSGMMVSVFLGGALLFGTVLVWLLGVFVLGWTSPALVPSVAMAVVTLAILECAESVWRRNSGLLGDSDVRQARGTILRLSFLSAAGGAVLLRVVNSWAQHGPVIGWARFQNQAVDLHSLHSRLWSLRPALAWALVPPALLLVRPILDRFWWKGDAPKAAAFARVLGRVVRIVILWAVFAVAWEIARYVLEKWSASGWAGILALLLAAAEAFRRVRNWVSISPTEARTGSLPSKLKPFVPEVLSYVVIFCSLILISMASLELLMLKPRWIFAIPVGVAAAVLLILWLVDPEQLGLRAFYRRRIVRTYLGATNPEAAGQTTGPTEACYNRSAVEHPDDDVRLDRMQPRETPYRPIHLVCSTANDLTGDHLGNLGRGSRMAVLSPLGMSLANSWRRTTPLTLGAALTASAAAFNTLMGSISRQVGPGVTFLLSGLNLRLGLWVTNPAASADGSVFPGWPMLTEFWSSSRSGVRLSPPGTGAAPVPAAPQVHLSDGAHFENLGLYELVRRHCRYIIVSDCGADPESVFDDLGNALRRIREDFGVEIELDTAPLVPQKGGPAQQHMVVGTIHYDRQCDFDQGIILYFKPTLTGDEPDDVLQYKSRNTAFPQESTVDQFYDEKQWEAYRRLGQHSAHAALRFLEGRPVGGLSRYGLFAEAYWRWYPTLADQGQKMIDQTQRFSQVLAELRQSCLPTLTGELLPEAREIGKAIGITPDEAGRLGLLVMEIAQVMEDAYIGLSLEQTWTNPMYAGWMNLFYRWTWAPAFRDWWPCIEPLYSRDFRAFLNDRCRLKQFTPGGAPATSREVRAVTDKVAFQKSDLYQWYVERKPMPPRPGVVEHFQLEFIHPGNGLPLAVGLLECEIDNSQHVAAWFTDELFVRPSLRGTNIAGAFLPEIIEMMRDRNVERIEVSPRTTLADGSPLPTDQANRAYRSDVVRLYKSQGFKLRRVLDEATKEYRQVLVYVL